MEEKLDSLNQLKVKGLILGPFHTVQVNEPATLDLNTIDPSIGTLEQLESLLDRAHKKGEASASDGHPLRCHDIIFDIFS